MKCMAQVQVERFVVIAAAIMVLAGCAIPYPIVTPEARKVQVFKQTSTVTNKCKLIGPITVESKAQPYKIGGDFHEWAVEQATISARERALTMGGDAIIVSTIESGPYSMASYDVIIQAQALRCQQ